MGFGWGKLGKNQRVTGKKTTKKAHMTHGWNAARTKGANGERTEGGRPGDGMENWGVGRSFHGAVSVFGGTGMKGEVA